MSPYPWSSWEPRGRTSSPNHSGVCSICPSGCLCLRSCGGAATERGWIGGGCSPGLASSGLVTLQCSAPCGGRRTGLPQDSRSHRHFFLQVNYGSGCSVVPGHRPQPVIRKPWHPGHTPCCLFSGTSSRWCYRSWTRTSKCHEELERLARPSCGAGTGATGPIGTGCPGEASRAVSEAPSCRGANPHRFPIRRPERTPVLPILGTKYGRGGSEGQRLRENCDPRIPLGNDEKRAPAGVAWGAERMRLTQAVSKCARSAGLASEQATWPCQKKANLFFVCPSLHFLNSVLRWPKIINFYKV